MNFVKAQKDVVNAILSGRRCGRFNVDDHNILITPDGCMGYIFPVSTIVFNLDKCIEITAFPILDIIKDENELKLLPDLRLDERNRSTYRRLHGNGRNVFVNVKFLTCWQNPRFWQTAENPHGVVVVTEGAKGANIPVGIILPIRSSWDDGTYYGNEGRM